MFPWSKLSCSLVTQNAWEALSGLSSSKLPYTRPTDLSQKPTLELGKKTFSCCRIFYAPINVKPVGGGRRGIGRDFDRSLWPGGRAFELSCCPGGRDNWTFVRGRDHKSFSGCGISVIFDLKLLPGGREFGRDFLENVKIAPYALPPPLTLIGALLKLACTVLKKS